MATIEIKISNPVSIDAANIQKNSLSVKAMETVKKLLTEKLNFC